MATGHPVDIADIGYNVEKGKYLIYKDGDILRSDGKILPTFYRNGYKCVGLWCRNRKGKTEYVHRILGKAFISNPKDLPCINHKDGDKLNNALDNLEWCTYSGNLTHAYKSGLNHKIKGIVCLETGAEYESIKQCAREIGVLSTSLNNCLTGRSKTCKRMHWAYIK